MTTSRITRNRYRTGVTYICPPMPEWGLLETVEHGPEWHATLAETLRVADQYATLGYSVDIVTR
jgi:hypothetical protein